MWIFYDDFCENESSDFQLETKEHFNDQCDEDITVNC